MRMNISVPDDLAQEVRERDLPISAICQQALREEANRARARAEVASKGFERVEVYDSKRERDVAFQGRRIGRSFEREMLEAWLTPKEAIAVYSGDRQELYTYDGYDEFAADNLPEDLMAEVAAVLGEKYVEELDI
jgi:hypothetical protein